MPLIVVNKNTPLAVETFSRIGKVVALDTLEVSRDAVHDAEILVVRSETKVDRELLDGSSVRFVGTVTIGTDHVDLGYLTSRGIAFASAPGSNSNSVAEYVAAALLLWSQRTGEALQEKTIGIVGVGNVGSRVERVSRALGMNVLLNDPPLARKTSNPFFLPLQELMDADVLTLHVPLTKSGADATYHLFDEVRISKMKRGTVLINTSRGAVVETNALHRALSLGRLSAAILDVWEGEPKIDVHLLNEVMLGTAHIAGYSLDGKVNALRMVYEAVCQYLNVPSGPKVEPEKDPASDMRILIPESVTSETDILLHAVRQTYDIELDDRMLRAMTSHPEKEHGEYFMRLRAGYRIRREFFNKLVELSSEQAHAQEVLSKLGFMTKVREAQPWRK
jgi:erythronate-4-phosphate dehydrogenase